MKPDLGRQASDVGPEAVVRRQATLTDRRLGWLLALSAWLVVTGSWLVLLTGCSSHREHIVVGSKNFTEQVILGELLAQHIESSTGLPVERRLNLGGTFICHQAIQAGDIDVYVEYTGTALTAILKQPPISDAAEVYRRVKQAYAEQFQLEWMEPLGFNNTFAMIVRGEDARALKIRTISQAAQHTSGWRAGFGPEFMERADGYDGLTKTYRLQFAQPPRIMDLGLMYRALIEKQVDIVAGNSTDGLIASLDLVVLEDDKHYFPPYEAAPVVRRQTLQRYPALQQALRQLGGCISAEQMRRLNYQVDGRQRDVRELVAEFRQSACR